MAVELADLQGNVLCGYGFARAGLRLLRIDDPAAGRRLLGALVPRLTSATPWCPGRPSHAVNVAVTADGLRALGAPSRLVERFPEEFVAGMEPRAAELGDRGEEAPDAWFPGYRKGQVHLAIAVHADDPEELDAIPAPEEGTALVHERDAALLPGDPHPREHFGFADGFAQPDIDDPVAGPYRKPGQGTPADDGGWRPLAPGEFVLGYRDEDGLVAGDELGPVGANGSFTVVRELRQDVAGFRAWLEDEAGPEGPEWLAARAMGRWRDGTPLALSPGAPRPGLRHDRGAALNDFRYGDDPEGHRCPLGAHIRRCNPRDALGWGGELSRRHRLIRRGMPYGEPLAEGAEDDGRERGLLFVCHQASIARQFEVIQSAWVADGDAFGLGDDPDPVLGGPREDRPVKFTIQGSSPRFLPLRRFVTLRGGAYLFTPGLRAASDLAAGRWDGL